jgi:hypothetical protein
MSIIKANRLVFRLTESNPNLSRSFPENREHFLYKYRNLLKRAYSNKQGFEFMMIIFAILELMNYQILLKSAKHFLKLPLHLKA